MKKLHLTLALVLAGATLNFTSCSKDEVETPVNNTPVVTTPTNGALIDGTEAQKSSEPAMNDKTAVLETTAGKFEVGFASKPTESGTYTVKSSIASKNPEVAARAAAGTLKEVTVKYTSKDNIVYKASDNAGGTVTITIKDGKIAIDINNLNVCYNTSCKKVSVKYDFAYTPPVVNPDPVVDPDPVVNPNPTTGEAGTGYVDGVKSVSSFGTGLWVNKAVVINTSAGSFQVWFKEKPTASGSYTTKSFMSVLGGQGGDKEAGFAFVPNGGSQLWSTDTSGGTIQVKDDGANWIIEAKNINACVNGTSTCKTFSVFYKVVK